MMAMQPLQRLVASGGLASGAAERLAASLLGCGGCRLRGLASTPTAGQGKVAGALCGPWSCAGLLGLPGDSLSLRLAQVGQPLRGSRGT